MNKIINTYKIDHSNRTQTQLYIIKTIQHFVDYKATNETDNIYFIKLNDLKEMISGKQHHTVKILKNYFISSMYKLIKMKII